MIDALLERFRQKDRLALARLLTLATRGEHSEAIRSGITNEHSKTARVVAVTGNSGVGKSTLVGRLIDVIRSRRQTVAVLACDPQSSLTGGALLGDRVRMPSHPDDAGLFIRSLAASGEHQGIAERLELAIEILQAYGFDVILLETVGTGQGDTAVREFADVVVLLLQPEIGDDLQWEKAGILEIADVVVIHKADLPGAQQAEAQVRELLNLPGCREVPVQRASAKRNEGLEELWNTIVSQPPRTRDNHLNGRMLLRLAQQLLAERYARHPDRLEPVVGRWMHKDIGRQQAVEEFLNALVRPP